MEQAKDDRWSLTEREKQTLRLIVRGHDAKSIARALDLSVHTINERLRDARRKMAVSSSREAARLLLDAEGDGAPPEFLRDTRIGDYPDGATMNDETAPDIGAGQGDRPSRTIIIGALLMTFAPGLLALASLTPTFPPAPAPAPAPATSPTTTTAPSTLDPAVVDIAQRWLGLVDRQDWDESYRAFGAAFRKLNTAQVWAQVSQKVRVPLGAMISRTVISHEELPAPPAGYDVVKFRTRFANKAEAVETVTLEREAGAWRVVGVMID